MMNLTWTLRSTGGYWPPHNTSAMELCRGTLCHALAEVRPTTTASQVQRVTPTTVDAVLLLVAVADQKCSLFYYVYALDCCVL